MSDAWWDGGLGLQKLLALCWHQVKAIAFEISGELTQEMQLTPMVFFPQYLIYKLS